MTTVTALPYEVAVTGEYKLIFYILKELPVALFMLFFYGEYAFEEFCDFIKAFLSGFLCNGWVHFFPLIGFAVGGFFKVVYCSADACENLIPSFAIPQSADADIHDLATSKQDVVRMDIVNDIQPSVERIPEVAPHIDSFIIVFL